MAQLQKIIKVTQEQYNTLQSGGTVGDYTGIDPSFIYLVEDTGSDSLTVSELQVTEAATFNKAFKVYSDEISGTQYENQMPMFNNDEKYNDWDVDAIYYSTGICTTAISDEAEDEYKYSFPAKSGTFALTNEVLCKDANNNYIAENCSITGTAAANSAAFGKESVVRGAAALASGYLCEALGNGSTAFGYKSKAEGTGSVAEGAAIESNGTTELADFTVNVQSKLGTGAINFSTSGSWAYGTASHVEGVQTVAAGYGAHAEGMHTIAIGDYSHTEGNYSIAEGTTSHAEGSGTWAAGVRSHAEGEETQALHQGSHAEGLGTIAGGVGSHAEGCGYYGGTTEVTAKVVKLSSGTDDWYFYNRVFSEDGGYSIYFTNLENYLLAPGTEILKSDNTKLGTVIAAFNLTSIAQLDGQPGVVFASDTSFSTSTIFSKASTFTFKIPAKGAEGEASHTGGYGSIALGDFSRSAGYHNLTRGQSSAAFGSTNTVSGDDSMSIGCFNAVGGHESFALGRDNILETASSASLVAGRYNKLSNGGTIITGSYNDVSAGNSIVVGNHNLINGSDSGAIGVGLKLMDGYGQLVCGKYNVVNPDAMFIVADGDDDANRRNVFQVTIDGDAIVENSVCCKDVRCETINGGTPCTYSWDANSGTLTLGVLSNATPASINVNEDIY